MPFVSVLKEKFALATIEERQNVITNYATPNTPESYYYQGLVVLQKIQEEVTKVEGPLQPRAPTQIELDLSAQLLNILSKLEWGEKNQLESRFHLLAYPFQTATSVEYIKKALNLTIQEPSSVYEDQKQSSEVENISKYPSVLDTSLIDGTSLILKELKDDSKTHKAIAPMAYPIIGDMWDTLDKSTQDKLIRMPGVDAYLHLLGDSAVSILADYYSSFENEERPYFPLMNHFTLDQMDKFIELIPNVVLDHTDFVVIYIHKLASSEGFVQIEADIWDNHSRTISNYVDRVNTFVGRLPSAYRKLKYAVKFAKLRIDIVNSDFDEERFINFLSCIYTSSTIILTSNQSETSSKRNISCKLDHLPHFGNCDISEESLFEALEEYLTGLIVHDKLSVSVESLSEYLDYHSFLKPLVAKIRLTMFPVEDAWIKDLGESDYEALVKESIISFTNASLKVSFKRKPLDTISLFVKTKNIPRLSVRVFQIDTENYWRIHLNDTDEQSASKNINLDGFRPTFEQDFDFSSEPAIRVKYNEFKFGQDGLAPDVFNGRGLWVIEFVGGENQCRAIVQKGYLRHVIQETIAGHVLRVLDEEGQVVQKAKIVYKKQVYETDLNSNILIPYGEYEEKTRIILVSSADNYCEPASFTRLQEKYDLKADFYINPEMISFNKTATVVVVPKLFLNEMPAPLTLLDDKMVLAVETNNMRNIKTITSHETSNFTDGTISFDFYIPEQVKNIEVTLKAKVKSTSGNCVDLSTSYNVPYNSFRSSKGVKYSFYLQKMSTNKYYIYVFGQNGEYKKNYELKISFEHAFTSIQAQVDFQTNEFGFVDLGELHNIKSIKVEDNRRYQKRWNLADAFSVKLPKRICIPENVQFSLACETHFHNFLYSLYSGDDSNKLRDETMKYLKKDHINGCVSIQGLPEGTYTLNLPSLNEGIITVDCTVIRPQVEIDGQDIWSTWIIGENKYKKHTGGFLHKPLRISEKIITEKGIQIKLDNWNYKTYAIVTTTAFVPNENESFFKHFKTKQTSHHCLTDGCFTESTRSLLINDEYKSEEHQYILNRAKAEKWVGSSLAKPSLLVFPSKHKHVSKYTKVYNKNIDMKARSRRRFNISDLHGERLDGLSFYSNENLKDKPSLAFLDSRSPFSIIPVSKETGTINIDSKCLGYGGNLLHVAIISGEQQIHFQQHITENDTLQFNDLRQDNDSNKLLVCNKIASKLSPKESLALHTREYEIIGGFEKLFTIVSLISSSGKEFEKKFGFLKLWPRLSLQDKLEIHQKNACHEFNLWLKKKNHQFFDKYIKPAIETKLQKEFMDWYLLDADLSEYRENLYFYNRLSIAEKALLASTYCEETLNDVLKCFRDSFDESKKTRNYDAIFDTILSQSTLSAIATKDGPTTGLSLFNPVVEKEDSDKGMALFDDLNAVCDHVVIREEVAVPIVSGEAESVEIGLDDSGNEANNDVEENDDFIEEQQRLREVAIKMKQKKTYHFVEPTSEWAESGYFDKDEDIHLEEFWIDYLKHFTKNADIKNTAFVSEKFIYALNNSREIWFVLSLMDLPFETKSDWTLDTSVGTSNKSGVLIHANNQPILVFYRTLEEYDESFAGKNDLMIRQEIFVIDSSSPFGSEDCVKPDLGSQSLEPGVEYGCHLVLLNTSIKRMECQLTLQIPNGSIPTQNSTYYQSEAIVIEPYSTWYGEVSNFYFPLSGSFSTAPIIVSSITDNKILGKLDAISIKVQEQIEDQEVIVFDSNTINGQSWSRVASKGTKDTVLSYLYSYRKLSNLNFDLLVWRMKEKSFARQVFDILNKREFYSNDLAIFGLTHLFPDIIRDLLYNNQNRLIGRVGYGFKSPLTSTNKVGQIGIEVFDYYPLFNARAHQMKPSPEILNHQFYSHYNKFLEYLCLKSDSVSVTDLVILVTYLLLQDRVREAQNAFNRIQNLENNNECQLQVDYLNAYLKTRVLVSKDSSLDRPTDLQPIKDIATKYKDFGVLKWRQVFTDLYNFANEVEEGDLFTNSSAKSSLVRFEPTLEFEIDAKKQELVLKYANIQSVKINYYDMDIEMVFSNSPFLNTEKPSSQLNASINWIKPSTSETITLPEEMEIRNCQDGDFDMIDVSQTNLLQFHRVPFTAGNKNVFVEVSSGNITRQHTYHANSLLVHYVESYGMVRVMNEKTRRPLAGVYVKVYCRTKDSQEIHFWKDGYTSLNGTFDYISVTQGNTLTKKSSLKSLMSREIDKLSILILSEDAGATVREVYPPEEN